MKGKALLRLLLCGLMIVPLAGSAVALGAEAAPLNPNATIVVCASQDWIRDYDRKLAADFTAETGVKIDFQLNPDNQYASIVKAKLQSGDSVDVFYSNPGLSLKEYSPDRFAYDLSDQPWIDEYTDWAKASITYEGKVLLFSTGSMDGWGLLYNQNVLDRINMKPATNYEELVALCDAMMEIGVTPIFEPGADTWHGCVWVLETGDWLNRKYGDMYERLCTPEGKFADYPEILLFTQQMDELMKKGYFGKAEDWLSYTWGSRNENMASGDFGMMVAHMAAAGEIAREYPDVGAENWPLTIIPLAGNETFSNSGGSMGRVLNKESKNINEVLAYFSFLARPENVQYAYDMGTSPNIAFKNVVLRPNPQFESLMASCNNVSGPDYTTKTPFYSADPIGRAYIEMWIGDKTPEECVAQIDKDRAMMFDAIN